jgi:hypothetical protein
LGNYRFRWKSAQIVIKDGSGTNKTVRNGTLYDFANIVKENLMLKDAENKD